MRAYKVTDSKSMCRNIHFEIGETYYQKGELKLCQNGFHFCRKLIKCFDYYTFDPKNKVYEIEVLGEYIGDPDDKECTNELKIIREITWQECLELVNIGDWNTGNSNTGDRNTGNSNIGDRNTGDRNTGNSNTGDRNTGNCNTGDWNTGNWNTGDRNIGNCNIGNWNTGNLNTGDRNIGNRNIGNWNTSNRNIGDWNTGDCNTGNWNTGNCNIGNWNTGNRNIGVFNIDDPDQFRVFGNWISTKDYYNIYLPIFLNFDLMEWKNSNFTDEEKKIYEKEIEITGGFVKRYEYKEAFLNSWKNADKKDRIRIKDIPGFSKEKFYEISGIDIDKD